MTAPLFKPCSYSAKLQEVVFIPSYQFHLCRVSPHLACWGSNHPALCTSKKELELTSGFR